MTRNTTADLDNMVDNLNAKAGRTLFMIERAGGKGVALVKAVEGGGHETLSPRLTTNKLFAWLQAFRTGYLQALNQ